MRLHRLEVEAFGPFADRTVVDFDALSEAGLFLLSGPTGAGKTSVLDAVCFALYGDVPGDRSTAKRLRSDQAAPGVAPRVLLECTVGQRRFRIERSPAWERPKRRGTGLTTQQASVTLTERREGAWIALSSRVDETADQVRRVLGMSLTQFTQVAMLPQGKFQTFLRAASEERQQLLQQLFRTARFAEVERWVRERRLTLARTDAAMHQRVADIVSRLSETADAALPDPWDVHDLRPAADEHALGPWGRGLRDRVHEDRESAAARAADAARDEATARATLEASRARAEEQRRLREAHRELTELEGRADEHHRDCERLDAARRAGSVVALLRHTRSRLRAVEETELRSVASLEVLTAHLGVLLPPDRAELESLMARAASSVARARACLPRVERLGRARDELAVLVSRQQRIEGLLARATADHAAVPTRLEVLRDAVEQAREAADEVRALTWAEHNLTRRLAAHADISDLQRRLQTSREEWLAAREAALELKEQLLVVQQARIEGMAAELAGALASGCGCPVCGSSEHPAKARSAPGAPDARAERSARARADDASLVEHAFAAQVHELESSLAAATARAGDAPADEVAAELATVRDRLLTAGETAERLDPLRAELTEAEADRTRVAAALVEHESALARVVAERQALEAETRTSAAEIASVLSDLAAEAPDLGPGATVPRFLAHAERTGALARAAAADLAEAQVARRQHAEGQLALESSAHEAGFDDADEAAAHVLEGEDLRDLAAAVEQHRDRLAAVRRLLADAPDPPSVEAEPDLASLADDHQLTLRRRDDSAAALHSATTRHHRLVGLVRELDALDEAWRPLRVDLQVATRLSAFVEGKSADNTLRMRLSAYVVAHRLSQVVAAANERLSSMSDQRYSLEHTGHRGAGETRGGLSLLVRDDWSGESRDPATLSGGETFVVSLALALGLSDVVAHESGGAALDTLFVDEGFGSLDADTLDDVLDVLDALRDGGRVVGLVSHVAEMRDRIPTQLLVTKARGGSAVRHRLCGTMVS